MYLKTLYPNKDYPFLKRYWRVAYLVSEAKSMVVVLSKVRQESPMDKVFVTTQRLNEEEAVREMEELKKKAQMRELNKIKQTL